MGAARYSDTAKADLADIFGYVAEHNITAADALVRMIAATCNAVADSVLIGRARPDLPGSLRSFPKENYVIYYRIVSGGIEVARVLHGARDIRRLF